MARQPRYGIPGIPQHVVQRGIDRSACLASEGDYARYLQELGEAAKRHRCAVHAYVLMSITSIYWSPLRRSAECRE